MVPRLLDTGLWSILGLCAPVDVQHNSSKSPEPRGKNRNGAPRVWGYIGHHHSFQGFRSRGIEPHQFKLKDGVWAHPTSGVSETQYAPSKITTLCRITTVTTTRYVARFFDLGHLRSLLRIVQPEFFRGGTVVNRTKPDRHIRLLRIFARTRGAGAGRILEPGPRILDTVSLRFANSPGNRLTKTQFFPNSKPISSPAPV